MSIEYLAGFIDGEGCLRWSTGTPRIEVSHTYPHILDQLAMALGGSVRKKRVPEGRRPIFYWGVTGGKAICALRKLSPLLQEKRAQALLLLLMCDVKDAEYREALDTALRALKRVHYKTESKENDESSD